MGEQFPSGRSEAAHAGNGAILLALAALALGGAALVAWVAEQAALERVLATFAFAATAVSAVLQARAELARRGVHAPALKRIQEAREVTSGLEVDAAVDAVEAELRSSGFEIDRVERSHGARVVLASRGGWAFSGSMLVHAGLLLGAGALGVAPPQHASALGAVSTAALVAGAALRLTNDPQVAWCVARCAEPGTAVDLVVSGCWFGGRVVRSADGLADRLARRFAR